MTTESGGGVDKQARVKRYKKRILATLGYKRLMSFKEVRTATIGKSIRLQEAWKELREEGKIVVKKRRFRDPRFPLPIIAYAYGRPNAPDLEDEVLLLLKIETTGPHGAPISLDRLARFAFLTKRCTHAIVKALIAKGKVGQKRLRSSSNVRYFYIQQQHEENKK